MDDQVLHKFCREPEYFQISETNIIKRSTVPDEKVPWSVEYSEYKPKKYVKSDGFGLLVPPECNSRDLKRGVHDIIFNAKEENGLNRLSLEGAYELNEDGAPRNPRGRTGLCDRGILERWGPNQEAVPILSRWARKGDIPGDFPIDDDKKEHEEVEEKKVEKELPTSLVGVWRPKMGGTQTVLNNDMLRDDADPPHFAAINNEKPEFWAHLWLNEKTKIKLRDIGGQEFTGILSLDKDTKDVKITWSDDDVWTLIEEEWDIETENSEKKDGEVLTRNGKPILEVVIVQRQDEKGWSIPNTSIKSFSDVSATAKSLYGEEDFIDFKEMSDEQKENTRANLESFFDKMHCVHKGYMDDPRNTDNSWIETLAYNFHDASGETVSVLKLNPEYAPSEPHWRRLYGERVWYPSQKILLEKLARHHCAFF